MASAAITTFKLNGQFLAIAEELAGPAGLTAAWWQVLGAVLGEPLTVAGIAREMGITRQSVQRIADILADRGLARYLPNPAHRRAKLLTPTDEGRAAIARISPGAAAAAAQLAKVPRRAAAGRRRRRPPVAVRRPGRGLPSPVTRRVLSTHRRHWPGISLRLDIDAGSALNHCGHDEHD